MINDTFLTLFFINLFHTFFFYCLIYWNLISGTDFIVYSLIK